MSGSYSSLSPTVGGGESVRDRSTPADSSRGCPRAHRESVGVGLRRDVRRSDPWSVPRHEARGPGNEATGERLDYQHRERRWIAYRPSRGRRWNLEKVASGALLGELARIGQRRGCGRIEWAYSTGTCRRSGLSEARREVPAAMDFDPIERSTAQPTGAPGIASLRAIRGTPSRIDRRLRIEASLSSRRVSTAATRSTSNVRLFDVGSCGPPI